MTARHWRPASSARRALVAGLAACSVGFAGAQEAQYPNVPIRIVAPYPAGGGTDTVARTLGAKLQEAWGRP